MIRVAARAGQLAARLTAHAKRIAAQRVVSRSRAQRTDWYSATALWPDMFGDPSDGK
jgi:hypothetical protein